MGDPQPVPQRKTPRLAKPLQPDKPDQGTDSAHGGDKTQSAEHDDDAQAQRQSRDALHNVDNRKG